MAPRVFVARSTKMRGIGAPAARKMRKLGTSQPPCSTASVRSDRNGVEAKVNVTFSASINTAARLPFQTSCNTTVVRNTTGIMMP